MKIFRSQFTLNANAKKKRRKDPKSILAHVYEKKKFCRCVSETPTKRSREIDMFINLLPC